MSRPSPAAREVLAALDAQSPNHPSPTIASVSLPRHYQTASYLLSQARTYQREDSPEHAYVLYRRFVVYNLQTLHKHPHYNLSRWDGQRAEYRKLCAEAMDQLECIREEVIAKYAHGEEQKADPREADANDEMQGQQWQQQAPSTAEDVALEARMSALVMEEQQQREQEKKEDSTYTEQLPTMYRAAEPPDHALLASAYTVTQPSAPPLEEQQEEATATTIAPASSPSAMVEEAEAADVPLLNNPVMPVVDRTKWTNLRLPVRPPIPDRPTPVSAPAMSPPSALPTRPAVNVAQSALPVRPTGLPTIPAALPYIPSPSSVRPSLSSPGAVAAPPTPLRAAALPTRPMPPQHPIPQPASNYRPTLRSLASPALRPLHVPTSLMANFMSYAGSNTAANIETCAILAGRLQHNRLIVTHCLIPTQHATASTCSTVDEMELLAVQTKLDLMTLGWIHTHPSQSCFLSSIDLHTQYGYQCMMAEAIAIVMAPTDHQRPSGVFSLSSPGMTALSQCDRSGFHEHDTTVGGSLYGTAQHVVNEERAQVTFMDLRKTGPSGVGGGGGAGGGGREVVAPRPAGMVGGSGAPSMYRPIPGPSPTAHSHPHPHSHPHQHPYPAPPTHVHAAAPPPAGAYSGGYPGQYRGQNVR